MNYSDLKSLVTGIVAGDSASGTTTTTGTTTGSTTGGTDGSGSASDTTTTVTGTTAADRLSNLLVPTTSEILWGIVSGDILSTAWQKLTSNTGSLMSIGFQQIAEITGTPFKQIFNYIGGGATYVCYVNGAAAATPRHQVSGAGGRHCRAAGDHRLCQGHDAADAPEDRQGRRGLGALGQ